MKKIRLNRIERPDKKSARSARRSYQVFLREGFRFEFPSGVKADVFLIQVSAQIDLVRLELNQVLVEVFTGWRLMWPYAGSSMRISDELEALRDLVNDLERILERSARHTGENTHSFVFKDLFNGIDTAGKCFGCLQRVYKLRSQTAELYRYKILEDRLTDLKGRLEAIGSDHPGRVNMQGKLS